MRRKFTLIILLLFTVCSVSFAQNITVSGKVSDNDGNAIPGVSVRIKATSNATSTDANGRYQIPTASGETLVFSSVGLTIQQIKITNNKTINVVLQQNVSTLNDVVVIGYGTQKSEKVSSAISTIKAAEILKDNPVRIEDALQGRVAGVTVVQNGSPGTTPIIVIRGIPSASGNEPLVVIDGVEQTLADFNALNPADIESSSILKDAAATAIYGVGGGNGVILVTTKTGKKNQETKFSFNSSYGVQQVLNEVNVLNATQFAAMANEGSTLSGGPVLFNNLTSLGAGTNWQDQVFKSAPIQYYQLSATGGSDKMTYYLAFGSTDQDGIVGGGAKSVFDRNNFTANLNFDLTSKLKFNINVTDAILNSKGIAENSFNSVLGEALNFDPTVPVYNHVANTPGEYGFSTLELQEVHNPLTTLQNTYNKDLGNKIYGRFELSYEIINGLKLTSNFGYQDYNDNSKSFTPLIFYGLNNTDNTMAADGSAVTGDHNSVSSVRNSDFNYDWETYANYNFSIAKDNHFEAVLGTAMRRTSGNQIGASRQDVPFNSWTYADVSAATGVNSATNTNAQTGYYYQFSDNILSYYARLNYDYKEKYLLTLSDREDGDQVFGADKRFANFYAGSLGWIASNEDFFHSDVVTFLKFRGSYGTSGNNKATISQTTSIVTGGPYSNIGNSNGYSFGNVFVPGSSVGALANPDLGWETDKQADIGVDIELSHKFMFNVDWYNKDVNGLLFQPTQSLYLGTVPASDANIGSTSTKGVDATFTYTDRYSKDFSISTSLTFSTFKSLVTATNADNSAITYGASFYNGETQTATIFEKGYAPAEFYGYKTDGLFQTQAEINKSPTQAGAVPGDIKYKDINGDGVITSADQTALGNPFPKFTMGWTLNLTYKWFDFSSFVYVSEGNKVFTAWQRNADFTNNPISLLGRWTGPGTTNDANTPRYDFNDANDNLRVSDRYIQDGSFIKIKNLVLGYTIPKSVLKGKNNSLRIYAQVKNVYTFTKYNGFDPEVANAGSILDSGVDYGQYPQARTYLVGIDFKF